MFIVVQLARQLPQVVQCEHLENLGQEWLDYQLMEDAELPTQEPLDHFWGTVSKLKLADGTTRFPTLGKLMKALMCIPHSNASSERAFSMMKKVTTEFRSELGQDTLCAIMALKYNGHECCHPNLFKDEDLLKKAKSATYLYNKEHKST